MPKTSPATKAAFAAWHPSYENLLSVKECRAVYRALGLVRNALARQTISFGSVQAVRDYLQLSLAGEEREVFMCLWLDSHHRLIEAERLFVGTLTEAAVYPREVVKTALRHNAAAVIVAHNHPSGVAVQSFADEALTEGLQKALDLVDVRVLDHFIVAGSAQPLSFAENTIRPFGPDSLSSRSPVKHRPRAQKTAAAKKKGGGA
jgi:DNA repair protein RadC